MSNKYPKIQSIYKRNPNNNYKFTDEYSTPEIAYLANNHWIGTEKIDGRNHRVIWDGNKIIHKGKTDKAHMPDHLINDLDDIFTPEIMKNTFSNIKVCLYGEAFGPKIQKGSKYGDKHSFILFDIYIDGWWLERDAISIIASDLNIQHVPIIHEGPLSEAVEIVKSGFNSIFGDFTAEGLVLKPKKQLFDRKGNRIITKVKHKDFK